MVLSLQGLCPYKLSEEAGSTLTARDSRSQVQNIFARLPLDGNLYEELLHFLDQLCRTNLWRYKTLLFL